MSCSVGIETMLCVDDDTWFNSWPCISTGDGFVDHICDGWVQARISWVNGEGAFVGHGALRKASGSVLRKASGPPCMHRSGGQEIDWWGVGYVGGRNDNIGSECTRLPPTFGMVSEWGCASHCKQRPATRCAACKVLPLLLLLLPPPPQQPNHTPTTNRHANISPVGWLLVSDLIFMTCVMLLLQLQCLLPLPVLLLPYSYIP